MIEVLMKFFHWAGSLTCHQIPFRSLGAGGAFLHVCARDTGIYLGAFLSIIFIYLKKRTGADRPPSLKYGIVFCFMFLPLMLDGLTSYLAIRYTDNVIRLFTGILFGIPIPFLLVPLLNFKIEGNNTVEVIRGWGELVLIAVSALLSGFVVLHMENISGLGINIIIFIISSVIIISQLCVYFTLSRAVVSLFWKGSRAGGIAASAIILIFCFFILFVISHYVFQPLRIEYGI